MRLDIWLTTEQSLYGEIVKFSPYTEMSKYDGKTIHWIDVSIEYNDASGWATLEEDWINRYEGDERWPGDLEVQYSVGGTVPLIYLKRNREVEVRSLNSPDFLDAARKELGKILLGNGVAEESVKSFTSLERRVLTQDEKAVIVEAIKRRKAN